MKKDIAGVLRIRIYSTKFISTDTLLFSITLDLVHNVLNSDGVNKINEIKFQEM